MSMAQALLTEFEEQAPVTRKFLERLPEDHLMWRPHRKSMSAGQLALHVATVPGSVVRFVQGASGQAPDFGNIPQPASREEVLKLFDESIATVRALLPGFDDTAMNETFRVLAGQEEVLAQPRYEFLRNIMLNHWYQHRGQLCVYLRLLEVPVPASWGPSADEHPVVPPQQQAAVA